MAARRFTLLLGLYFLVVGVQGLFMPMVFGIFTTNLTHALIELVLAAAALLWAAHGSQRAFYLDVVGAILVVVGALRLIPATSSFVVDVLNVNIALAVANLLVGAVAIAFGINDRRPVSASGMAPAGAR